MADNVELNPGVGGKVVKTTELSDGTHVQRVNSGNSSTRTSTTSTVDVALLALNNERIRAVFTNNADQDFLLAEGTTAATAADCTVRMPPGSVYIIDDYLGAVHGKFASAVGSGQLNVTEVV